MGALFARTAFLADATGGRRGASRRTTGGRRGASRRTMGFLNDRLEERRTGLDFRTFLKKEGGFVITFFTLLLLLRGGDFTIRHGVEAGEATVLRGGEATVLRGVEGDFTVRRGVEATILRGEDFLLILRAGLTGILQTCSSSERVL